MHRYVPSGSMTDPLAARMSEMMALVKKRLRKASSTILEGRFDESSVQRRTGSSVKELERVVAAGRRHAGRV
jgi:hypothetical protein